MNVFFSFYFSQSVLWILKETFFLFAELFHGFLFKTLLVNSWLFIIYSQQKSKNLFLIRSQASGLFQKNIWDD